MKTEHLTVNNDPIWNNHVELLPSSTECLPIIGSCQVSSILQNLDNINNAQNNEPSSNNMDLIILENNDYKLPLDDDGPLNLHSNNYMMLKDPTTTTVELNFIKSNLEDDEPCSIIKQDLKVLESTNLNLPPTTLTVLEENNSNNENEPSIIIPLKQYDRESFEDMLYFVCNLCPFLCIKETKITEHLESVHKNKTITNKLVQLKCPACANIFYHRASLKSHLMHDHCVINSDLNLIIQAVLFYSNKENNKKTELKKIDHHVDDDNEDIKEITSNTNNDENNKPPSTKAQSKIKLKEVINLLKKPPAVAENNSSCVKKVTLPQMDNMNINDSEKLITNLMKNTEPNNSSVNKTMEINRICAYTFCKVTLFDSQKMDYHIESHLNEGFKCLECQEKFSAWKPLTSHLWRLHKIDMELFACDKCDYKTKSLCELNNVHKLIHSNVKAFQCEICEKLFKNQKQLRNHRTIHRDKRNNNNKKKLEKCELCAKSFSEKRRLRYHMDSVHKKLKPFLCNYCGYKGSCKASLKMHIRSHTGEKPFSCDQCSYSSTDHNSLRRHKLRHSGQKPYKCSYCSYACIQSSTYKVHLKTKHAGMENGLMFACFLCQFRTVNKDMYNTHLVSIHDTKQKIQ